ncbi:unnamed protein product [Kuraishia capsulata CBS 1993]|uniref:Protein farnesyltransferase/geranylgeranyltransferase type-1 subunit alpha n=1 Tax=Kuraishia capsulata CBS 1993 TaxID=1382522 RepID=W6MMV4_9ASCO|nr:uncharacterized protein KUCA_T00003896001 [Kuraishia capsulata CBS 1993]CDK27916.1 unnamed protein product [Kuraishia capsulata CBS 1993]
MSSEMETESLNDYNWDDIESIPIKEEASSALCRIMYSEEYKQQLGYLRALLTKQEYSARALLLTDSIIDAVPAHYTAWNYRYNIVKNIDRDLERELVWCQEVAYDKPKNYQIWHYRSLIIELVESRGGSVDISNETTISDDMLEEDSKNYHVWAYRKWLVRRYQLFRDNIEDLTTKKMIALDVRNNSAWSHRFFVMLGDFGETRPETASETVEQEIGFAKIMINQCPENPSAWSYLQGIYKLAKKDLLAEKEFCELYAVGAGKSDQRSVESRFSLPATELLARIYEVSQDNSKASSLYSILGSKYDPMRRNYWEMKRQRLDSANSATVS